jgi:glycosyltransferase involved in cell wall biosynthesis
MIKYSFIVPVYNCEKYIQECVQTILNQTYRDYEVILIDDGSTDSSSKICDEIAEQNCNVLVIHKSNGGPSSARNTGIKVSSGEFIWFIDSDDVISSEYALQQIDSIISRNQVDILYFLSREYNENFIQVIRSQEEYPEEGGQFISGADLLVKLEKRNKLLPIFTSPVNKVFRKSVLVKNCVYFEERFRCYEEDEFLCKAAYYGKSFYFLNDVLYHVRIRPQSVSTTVTSDSVEKKLKYRIELVDMCCNFYSDKEKAVQQSMNKFYSYYYLFALRDYFKLDTDEQRKDVINFIKSKDNIFKYMWNTKSKYLKLISIIYLLMGIRPILLIRKG